jgi:hypothetical protein
MTDDACHRPPRLTERLDHSTPMRWPDGWLPRRCGSSSGRELICRGGLGVPADRARQFDVSRVAERGAASLLGRQGGLGSIRRAIGQRSTLSAGQLLM